MSQAIQASETGCPGIQYVPVVGIDGAEVVETTDLIERHPRSGRIEESNQRVVNGQDTDGANGTTQAGPL